MPNDPRRQRFIRVLQKALELETNQRDAFLEAECGDDQDLRRELSGLLRQEKQVYEAQKDTLTIRGPDSLLQRASLQRGDRVGPYRIDDLLGEGGMGEVYLAHQEAPVRRKVALKVIKLGMDTREVVARFEAERQALAMMNHPNIARVYEAGSMQDGRPFFAMEYVPGAPIGEYCDRHRLDVRGRLELLKQVCRGIHSAHRKGILHRDLKPSNILVANPDGEPTARIIDFGVAKAMNQQLTEKTVYTPLGRAMGTPTYMSPEQTELTPEEVDHRADIYSLGVLLYELLVGETPLDRESLKKAVYDEIIRRIREEEPPTPSVRWSRLNVERRTELAARRAIQPAALHRTLRGDLDWITMRALEKDRRRRYATAAELADDIDRHLRGEVVEAGPPSRWYRLQKYAAKNRGIVTGTSAVFFALLAGFIASMILYLQAEENARQAEENARAVRSLSDVNLLRDLEAEADRLWPATPEKKPAMDGWLAEASEFVDRIPLHRSRLEQLRARAVATGDTWTFASREDQWHHENLEKLVRGLEGFNDPQQGLIARVRARAEFAGTVKARTIDEHREEWNRVIGEIADVTASPAYRGLTLTPQLGLIPLGRNRHTGLFEFSHLATGVPSARRADGWFEMNEAAGVVFVLLPGGRATLGATQPSPESSGGPGVHVDPQAAPAEGPAHEVELEPFFLSAFEMTQGQWRRVAGNNPSHFHDDLHDLRHPVESVSWLECSETLRRLGLSLPTEAQWEYAARAGSTTPWCYGDRREALRGKINIADLAARRAGNPWEAIGDWLDLDDGFAYHAPVGSFPPNVFGLYEVHGNVWEWCRDLYGAYELPAAPGTGERQVGAADSSRRVRRGGSFGDSAKFARSAFRYSSTADFRSGNVGLRPARAVTRLAGGR